MNEITINSWVELDLGFFSKLLPLIISHPQEIIINFKLDEEFDGDSKGERLLLKIINLLEDYQFNYKGKILIKWHYPIDNQEILEIGEEFAEDIKLEFSFISY